MKIHGVVDNDIHPPRFGSTQRSFGLFRGMARHHDVDVLCVVPYRNRGPRHETAAGVRLRRRRAWYTAAAWRAERLGLAPLMMAAHGHASRAKHWLGELPRDPDALCIGPFFGGLLKHSDAPVKVYASQNVEYDHFRHTAPERFRTARWTDRMRSLEGRVVEQVDLVSVCSHEDALRMHELYGVPEDRVTVTPNGYDETAFRPPRPGERERARKALGLDDGVHLGLFLGSDAEPNRMALNLLIDRVVPRLASGGFRLLVVGGVARHVASRRERWLITRPPVDDVLPYLHAADAGLNPVLAGGGSNVKVPTYLATGLAAITTPFGLRGYADLEPLARVAEADAFAEAWAERPRGWHARGEAAPAVLENYAWGAIGARLGNELAARCTPAVRHGRIPA